MRVTISIEAQPAPLSVDSSGTVRVGGTRLTLDAVVDAYKRGDTPQEIVTAFPGIDLADAYAIIAYYLRHRPDVEAYLQEQEAKAAAMRQKIEARQGSQAGLRERLFSRRAQKQIS